MPELPEVEIVKQSLIKNVKSEKILRYEFNMETIFFLE